MHTHFLEINFSKPGMRPQLGFNQLWGTPGLKTKETRVKQVTMLNRSRIMMEHVKPIKLNT